MAAKNGTKMDREFSELQGRHDLAFFPPPQTKRLSAEINDDISLLKYHLGFVSRSLYWVWKKNGIDRSAGCAAKVRSVWCGLWGSRVSSSSHVDFFVMPALKFSLTLFYGLYYNNLHDDRNTVPDTKCNEMG